MSSSVLTLPPPPVPSTSRTSGRRSSWAACSAQTIFSQIDGVGGAAADGEVVALDDDPRPSIAALADDEVGRREVRSARRRRRTRRARRARRSRARSPRRGAGRCARARSAGRGRAGARRAPRRPSRPPAPRGGAALRARVPRSCAVRAYGRSDPCHPPPRRDIVRLAVPLLACAAFAGCGGGSERAETSTTQTAVPSHPATPASARRWASPTACRCAPRATRPRTVAVVRPWLEELSAGEIDRAARASRCPRASRTSARSPLIRSRARGARGHRRACRAGRG